MLLWNVSADSAVYGVHHAEPGEDVPSVNLNAKITNHTFLWQWILPFTDIHISPFTDVHTYVELFLPFTDIHISPFTDVYTYVELFLPFTDIHISVVLIIPTFLC